jgi:hypothetical protein
MAEISLGLATPRASISLSTIWARDAANRLASVESESWVDVQAEVAMIAMVTQSDEPVSRNALTMEASYRLPAGSASSDSHVCRDGIALD